MKTLYLHLLLLSLIGLTGCVSPTRVDYDSASIEKIRSYRCYTIDTRETRAHYQDVALSPIVDRRIERSAGGEPARVVPRSTLGLAPK